VIDLVITSSGAVAVIQAFYSKNAIVNVSKKPGEEYLDG